AAGVPARRHHRRPAGRLLHGGTGLGPAGDALGRHARGESRVVARALPAGGGALRRRPARSRPRLLPALRAALRRSSLLPATGRGITVRTGGGAAERRSRGRRLPPAHRRGPGLPPGLLLSLVAWPR